MIPARVERYWIPGGNAGARATVRKMRKLAWEALASPLLREMAGGIVARAPGPAAKARSIRDFLTQTVRFVHDPSGLELIRSPAYLLREIEAHGEARGDCDDVATLGAALALAVGLPVRFVLLGFVPGGPFSHVLAEVWTGAEWMDLDTTAPEQFPPGLRIHSREELRV